MSSFDGDRLNELLEAAVFEANRALEQKAKPSEPVFRVKRIELAGERYSEQVDAMVEFGPRVAWRIS